MLDANAASLTLTGLALGKAIDRRFYLLAGTAAGFLLQHAIQGWSPPLPLLRWLGFRTQAEIEAERYALKALRGDFADLAVGGPPARRAREALAAVGCPV